MIITNLTASDYWFGPMHLPAGSGQTLNLDDTTDTSLYLLDDEVADAVNTLYLASNITVSSAAAPFPRATGTPALLHGDGSPEGMVYAPQGSLYLRRDTVQASTSLYTKQTGITQNTGWASVLAAAGDLIPSAAASRSGALLCDGTSYAITAYPVLFAAIGTTYGSVDSAHFNVPDLRGRLPLGASATPTNPTETGTGYGATPWTLGAQPTSGAGGEQTHTLVTGEMPSHNHADAGHGHTWSGVNDAAGDTSEPGNYPFYIRNDFETNWTGSTANIGGGYANIQDTGGGGAHNILAPVSVVNWFILHG